MMNAEEALAATTNNMVPTTTTEADAANNNSSTPHSIAASTPHGKDSYGKDSNGSTIVTPRPNAAREAATNTGTDANGTNA